MTIHGSIAIQRNFVIILLSSLRRINCWSLQNAKIRQSWQWAETTFFFPLEHLFPRQLVSDLARFRSNRVTTNTEISNVVGSLRWISLQGIDLDLRFTFKRVSALCRQPVVCACGKNYRNVSRRGGIGSDFITKFHYF